MEFDSYFWLNCSSLAATILTVIIAFTIVIQRVKQRWPTTANCWFCNENAKIYMSEIDWWQCPACNQYNGFSKDGDYKFDIPEHRNQTLNSFTKLHSFRQKNETSKNKNGLCKTCNQNEELKMYELRSIDHMWKDSDIDIFKKNLELKYPLCTKCSSFVNQFLQKQALWLTQYKMLFFKHRSINILVNHSPRIEGLCRFVLIIFSSATIYYRTYQSLPFLGAILQIITGTRVPGARRKLDFLLTLVWLGMGTLIPFNSWIYFTPKLKLIWNSLEYITGYQMIIVLSSVLGFMNLITNNTSTSGSNILFKRLDSPCVITPIPNMQDHLNHSDIKPSTNEQLCYQLPDTLIKPSLVQSQTQNQTPLSSNFRIYDNQHRPFSSNTNHSIGRFEVFSKPLPSQIDQYDKYILNDGLKNLNNLSLSVKNQKQSLKSSNVFERKVYSTTTPDLFSKSKKLNFNRKYILSPPKLKNVTQTSWVAGGYWQMGMEPPSLSRSSSQSSGFGSAGSNCAPSREPSVVNDVDRYSVMSDIPIQCYLPPRQSISPTNSVSQHSGCRCQEFTGCISNPTANLTFTPLCTQTARPRMCHSYHVTNQCIQNPNMIPRNQDVPCTTYPTNSTWLQVLLGGSLVFNITVLCMLLLYHT